MAGHASMLRKHMDFLESYFDCNAQNCNIKLLILIRSKTFLLSDERDVTVIKSGSTLLLNRCIIT